MLRGNFSWDFDAIGYQEGERAHLGIFMFCEVEVKGHWVQQIEGSYLEEDMAATDSTEDFKVCVFFSDGEVSVYASIKGTG